MLTEITPMRYPMQRMRALSCCCNRTCGQAFVSAELLYWRAFETGLDTCVPNHVSNVVTSKQRSFTRFNGRCRDLNFEWNPGVRVNGWYELPCTCWDEVTLLERLHRPLSRSEKWVRVGHLFATKSDYVKLFWSKRVWVGQSKSSNMSYDYRRSAGIGPG